MILITGATGFIGRSLTNTLTLAGAEWRAYNGRINNPLALRQQLSGVQTVYHLAGSETRGRGRLLQHVDIEGTERLLEECRRAGVQHMIVMSRLGADANAVHPLLQAKGEVERLVRHSPVPYTIVRSATLYGRNDRFFEIIVGLAIWSWPIVWLPGGGRTAWQPLWLQDLVDCLQTIPQRSELINQTITLAGSERLKYRDLVPLLLNAADISCLPLPLPMVLLRPLSALLFRWWWWPAVSRFMVDRFFVPEVAELDTVRRQFGFRPARLADTLSYLRRPGLRWRLFRR
jgi:NADH dehydrogenase (ubiquinone) 1 alpha subcomplex subunit 9